MQTKKWLPLLLALALALAAPMAAGESAPDSAGELIGVWEINENIASALVGGDVHFPEGEAPTVTFEFGADGTCIVTLMAKGEVGEDIGTYAVYGNTLTFRMEGWSGDLSFKIDGDALTLYEGEIQILEFNRVKEPVNTAPDTVSADALIGAWAVDWEATAAAGGDLDIYFDGGEAFALTITFHWDGTFVQRIDEEEEILASGEYTVSGDTLILDAKHDSELVSFTIDGNLLTLAGDNEGEILVFNRLAAESAMSSANALTGVWGMDDTHKKWTTRK